MSRKTTFADLWRYARADRARMIRLCIIGASCVCAAAAVIITALLTAGVVQ